MGYSGSSCQLPRTGQSLIELFGSIYVFVKLP
jgi:hypothetical protein